MQITRGKQETAQKVVLYGPEGIGKTTFASKFPEPLFIDTEGSTKHLDVARTPKPTSWTMLLDQVKYVKQNPGICQTLVIDTADWAEQLCITSICSKSQKQGIEDFGYGKGYVYLAEEFGKLLNALEELVDIGINIAIMAHAYIKRFDQPDELGSYDRWELKLQKKTAPLLKEWADMVLFANYKTTVINVDGQGANKGKNKAQGGKRVMHTMHTPSWDAKNRHNLPEELPLDFESIRACIPVSGKATTTPTAPPVETKTPDPVPQTPEQTKNAVKEIEQQGFEKLPDEQKQESMNYSEKPNSSPAQTVDKKLPDYIPKALADLMITNDVTESEILEVVYKKGYYPVGTPISNFEQDFINGCLVGAWAQVYAMIEAERVPF